MILTSALAPSECPRLTVAPTSTSGSPAISKSYVQNSTVVIEVQSTIVVGRTISQFLVGSCPRTFVKLNHWLDCNDTFLGGTNILVVLLEFNIFYVSAFPLSLFSACNISFWDDGYNANYEIPIVVHNTEELFVGGFNITRTITDTLTIVVQYETVVCLITSLFSNIDNRLPKTVDTGNTTHVNSTVAILAVLTKQAYLTDSNRGLSIHLINLLLIKF